MNFILIHEVWYIQFIYKVWFTELQAYILFDIRQKDATFGTYSMLGKLAAQSNLLALKGTDPRNNP